MNSINEQLIAIEGAIPTDTKKPTQVGLLRSQIRDGTRGRT